MKQRYKVTLADPDAEYQVTSDGRDMRAWEGTHEEAYFSAPSTLVKFAELAYLASTRTGQFTGTWADFDARCVGALPVKDENPTESRPESIRSAHTVGSSSPSQSAPASPRKTSSKRTKAS